VVCAGSTVVWVQHCDAGLEKGSPPWQLVPELSPGESEPRVHKTYGDSFEDTDKATGAVGVSYRPPRSTSRPSVDESRGTARPDSRLWRNPKADRVWRDGISGTLEHRGGPVPADTRDRAPRERGGGDP